MKIKDLFSKLGVENKENAIYELKFPLGVKTPYGYKNIVTAFRTEKQTSITTYFKNNTTLKTSENHLLKVNGDWKKVKDIIEDDVVETETGTTSIIRKHKKKNKYTKWKQEVLYDISVEGVHCYYSNGILSHNSWLLARLGAEAMKQKKHVLHVTLELNECYVGLRYDAYFSGIAFQEVRKNVPTIKAKLDELKNNGLGRLFVKYYPLKTASPQTIKTYVDQLQLITGIKIGALVVDYADILRPFMADKNANSYTEAGSVYEELRTVAGELQIPIWTASQSNRCHFVDDVVVTRNGLLKMGMLKIGNEILTHKGFKKVTRVYSVIKQPAYKIRTKGGKEIRISIEHKLPTADGKMKSIINGLSIGDKLFIKK